MRARHKRYEFIEHTADIGVRAHGDTLADAFAVAARAMFDIITDHARIQRQQKVEFTLEGLDKQSLLVTFLSRLIVLHEVDRLVFSHFAVDFPADNTVHVIAEGEPFDRTLHGRGLHVKAVTYHMMEVIDGHGTEPSAVQVLFDI